LKYVWSLPKKDCRKAIERKEKGDYCHYSAEYLENLFGVAKSFVHDCVYQVCESIIRHLLEEYVCFQERETLKKVIKAIRKSGHSQTALGLGN
jgi:hypothetical protein